MSIEDSSDDLGVQFSRYDAVLAAIPAAFLTAAVAAGLLAVPVEWSVALAGAVGSLAVADALFVNPPVGRRPIE